MGETTFVLTNDDAGSGDPGRFAEVLDFLAAQQVRATFFVIPAAGGVPLDARPEWLAVLRRALDEGHELQQHGYDHGDTFEFGVPPDFVLDIIPQDRARWQRSPEAVRAGHTLARLRERLARGREIFRRALGYDPAGFRAPCASMCDETYRALAELGFRWSSNLILNPMGWRYINHDYAAGEPWLPGIPPRPFVYRAGLVEVPMVSEYTWFLRPEDYERHYALIEQDFTRASRETGIFVSVTHFFAITREWAAGMRVYERLFAHARARGQVTFCTVSGLLERRPPAEQPDAGRPAGS